MRWQRGHRSRDVEDRRGSPARRVGAVGAVGVGGALLALVVSLVLGVDLSSLIPGGGSSGSTRSSTNTQGSSRPPGENDPDAELVSFVSFVLDDVQDTWSQLFQERGQRYERAKLVLFTDRVESACGFQSAATGPFYCPADNKAYIDLGFYQALSQRLGAPGDFAQAYVIAHEVAHHVQNLVGTSGRVHRARRGSSESEVNQMSIRLELQADCLAGVWAHHTAERDVLERGDIEEGLGAAAAIGDDRLQRRATGTIQPETWTHGSSDQRVRWFKRGLESGDMDACDTFDTDRL